MDYELAMLGVIQRQLYNNDTGNQKVKLNEYKQLSGK